MRVQMDPGPLGGGALVLARDGRWIHDGDPVRHERLCALLDRSVARDEEGRLMLTTGRDRLPFASEDAPLRVKTALVDERGLSQVLRDDRVEPLTAASALCIDDEGRLRTRVSGPRGGAFWALWERPAAQALMPFLHDGGDEPCVDVGGSRLALTVVESSAAPRDWTR